MINRPTGVAFPTILYTYMCMNNNKKKPTCVYKLL